MTRRLALLFVCLPLMVAVAADTPPMFRDIEESLTCQCGCGLTVHACNHLQCPSAIPLRVEIREQIAQGKSKDAILAHFTDKYGEKILSSPTATGFNLVAWTMPFLLLAIGAVVVGVAVNRWRGRGGGDEPPAPDQTTDPQHRAILERELKEFKE